MTIPTRDVRRFETRHSSTLNDQILQHLVKPCAHVDIAIGERRTIVQNEKWIVFPRFLNLFVPKGVPKLILPAIVAIEVLSFLSRPVSHSVRLFANMLAGHITLQVFAGFVIMLGSAGILGLFGATLPFIMVVLLTALEVLVAFLQAYVFAILTCIYLNDAIHPGH